MWREKVSVEGQAAIAFEAQVYRVAYMEIIGIEKLAL